MIYNAKFHMQTSIWMTVLAVLFTMIFSMTFSYPTVYIFLFLFSFIQFCINSGFFLQLFTRTRFFYIIFILFTPIWMLASLIAFPILLVLDIYVLSTKPEGYVVLFKNNRSIRMPTLSHFEDHDLKQRISKYESRMSYSAFFVLTILLIGISVIIVSFQKFPLWVSVVLIIVEILVYILLTAYLGRKYRSETEKFLDILLIDKDGETICKLFKLLTEKYPNNQFIANAYMLFAAEQLQWDEVELLISKYRKYEKEMNYKIAAMQYYINNNNTKEAKAMLRDIDMETIRRISINPNRRDLILLRKELEWYGAQDYRVKLKIAQEMVEIASNPFEEVQIMYYLGYTYELLEEYNEASIYYEKVCDQGNTMGVRTLALNSIKRIEKNQD